MPEGTYEERRARLLQAATQVFAEKGFSASNKEIARAAGITPAAIYWYFPSKEDLLSAVVTQYVPDAETIRQGLRFARDFPPRQALSVMLSTIASVLENRAVLPIVKVFFQEAIRNEMVRKVFQDRFVLPMASALEEYVAYQMERGVFRRGNPRAVIQCFIGPMIASNLTKNLLELEYFRDLTFPEIFTTALDLFLDGILIEGEGNGHA